MYSIIILYGRTGISYIIRPRVDLSEKNVVYHYSQKIIIITTISPGIFYILLLFFSSKKEIYFFLQTIFFPSIKNDNNNKYYSYFTAMARIMIRSQVSIYINSTKHNAILFAGQHSES